MKTVKTPAGTELPLISLKGKDYLMVAHRLQWFNEVESSFRIETDFLRIEADWAIARSKITVFNKEGREVKSVMATKKETQKDFPDFMEKAETGSIGRALALAGYGTQFALSDLDEGNRLADSPVVSVKDTKKAEAPVKSVTVHPTPAEQAAAATPSTAPKISSFRKNKPLPPTEAAESNGASNGWE